MNLTEALQTNREKLQTPLVALSLAVLLTAGILWTLWSHISALRSASPISDLATRYQPPAQYDINLLAKSHLMGAGGNLDDLPLASLGVTLVGVFINPNGQSSALINFNDDETKTYHVGDTLAPNVVIEKILPDSLIVQHNGQLEKLAMAIVPITFSNTLPTPLWPDHS